MKALSDQHSVKKLCEVLDVSRSACCRERGTGKRAEEDAVLFEEIEQVFNEHRERYGSPRIHAELLRKGIRCGENRVARLMRENGLHAVVPKRKAPLTTDSRHGGPIAPNLLKTMKVWRANQAWAMDITYIWAGKRWVYLAAVLDLHLHKIAGWAVSKSLQSGLVTNALNQALVRQGYPEGVTVHSDRGVQYASKEFIELVEALGYTRSMSAKGNCYDNATMESFFGVLKREEMDRWEFASLQDVRNHVFDYIETYYNRKRIHTTIGMPPEEFEALEKARLQGDSMNVPTPAEVCYEV
mgnify:CR=1 FL=1